MDEPALAIERRDDLPGDARVAAGTAADRACHIDDTASTACPSSVVPT